MSEKDEILRSFELLKEELKAKTEPQNEGAPEIISIEHDDYHASLIGRTADGRQFFVAPIFVPGGDEFVNLFLFDDEGNLLESRIENLGPRETFDIEKARALRGEWLAQLGELEYQDIRVKPFAVEQGGEMFGMIPTKYEDYWVVEVLPGNVMAFTEPWDSGIYDT